MPVTEVSFSLGLPFGLGSLGGKWQPSEEERLAAWEMYVELITRVSIEELSPGEGLLREALSSIYTLFETTRNILRKYGPAVAAPNAGSDLSFGIISVTVLNRGLRPFLARWHPVLADYESRRPPEISPIEHEHRWERAEELRRDLNEVRNVMKTYAHYLAKVADVPSLLPNNLPPPEVH